MVIDDRIYTPFYQVVDRAALPSVMFTSSYPCMTTFNNKFSQMTGQYYHLIHDNKRAFQKWLHARIHGCIYNIAIITQLRPCFVGEVVLHFQYSLVSYIL